MLCFICCFQSHIFENAVFIDLPALLSPKGGLIIFIYIYIYIYILVLTCRFKSTEFCFHVVSRLFIMFVKYFVQYFAKYFVKYFVKLFWTACLSSVFQTSFVLESHYSLDALLFVLAARCLHYPFIACCPLLAISFLRLLPVVHITFLSLVARRYLC